MGTAFAKFEICFANPNDAPGIAKVQIDAWQQRVSAWAPFSFIEKFQLSRPTEKYAARIADPNNRILVAKIDHEVVGVIGAKPNLAEPKDYEQSIFGLYVSPDHERNGIGSALLQTCSMI